MPMLPRERVLAAIHHEAPDRVPLIIGTSNTTSLKMAVYQQLKQHLSIEAEDRYLYDWPELGTAALDEATLRCLHSDARGVLDRFPAETYRRNNERPLHTPFISDWGDGQIEIEPGLWFPGVHPLADAETPEQLETYAWPDMNDPSRVAHVRAQVEALAAAGEFAVIGTPWLLFPLERAVDLQGMDKFYLNLGANPDFASALLKKTAELCKALMANFLREAGDQLDIIKIGDDLGMQQGLLMSPAMYQRILKPIHADYIAFIKARTNAKLFFHTDGDVFNLLDDFVEIGVDILNPIQTSAGKMSDLATLKKRYGRNLAFCGAVDTHHVLPFGTPADVRQEVRRVIDLLAPGGGFLVSSVHTIMNDVPPENILALVEAVEEFGRYPLQ